MNFHIYFLNMDISLIIRVTCLKLSIHDARTHLEGSVSQILIQALVFVLLYEEK